MFFAALFLQLLVSTMMAPELVADKRREFISTTMNADVRKLWQNCSKEIIGEAPFSSKNNSSMDYLIGFFNTDHGLLVTLQTIEQRFDEFRKPIPDLYASEYVAIVFVDKSLLWYKSVNAKSILKAKMGRLIGERSI